LFSHNVYLPERQRLAMTNENCPCKVVAVYPDHQAATAAARALDDVTPDNIRVIELSPDVIGIGQPIKPETGVSCDTAARDSDACDTAGAAVSAAMADVIAATSILLFISAPVVAPLIVLGYGTMIGGVAAGSIRGLRLRANLLGDLLKDVLKAGYHVVIVHSTNEAAQQRVEVVIGKTMPEQVKHN
jgi:hypothetical protein